MDLIPSFSVDHTKIVPGIFTSRVDTVGNELVTTYDIRVTKPNVEPAVDVAAMHSLEHLIATFLRNDSQWKDQIIYWGPMGCLTGNYLIMKGEWSCHEVRTLMLRAFQYVVDYTDEVPGTTPATCGNYLLHDLPMAKWEAARYIQRLTTDFHHEYPGIERPEDAGGMVFHDA